MVGSGSERNINDPEPILNAFYERCEHINCYSVFYLGRKLSIPACFGERERGKIGAPLQLCCAAFLERCAFQAAWSLIAFPHLRDWLTIPKTIRDPSFVFYDVLFSFILCEPAPPVSLWLNPSSILPLIYLHWGLVSNYIWISVYFFRPPGSGSINKGKKWRKTLISTVLWLLYEFFLEE